MRMRAVAGAGTGNVPCAHVTNPPPTSGRLATTRTGPSSSSSNATEAMSLRASAMPTSWKCISETGRPCAFASASAIKSYTACTCAFTASDALSDAICVAMSAREA